MLKEFRQSTVIKLIFVISVAISLIAVYFVDHYNYQQKRASIQKLSSSHVSLIQNNIYQALSATYPLAALVRTQNGDITGFTELATEMLPSYPGLSALQLQPDGILKHVVPLEGNEGTIGHNLLLNPERIKEAFLARDTGKLTLAGPFDLIQGGIGAAARLPIYLEDSNGDKLFWGFSTALIRFPEVLGAADLPSLAKAGIAYELSRIHPDTNKTQIIIRSNEPLTENPEEFNIKVPNSLWTFKVSPIKGWRSYPVFIIGGLLGLIFTLLVTFTAILIRRLQHNRQKLEQLVLERTRELNDNLTRLELALGTAGQGWYDLNLQTGVFSVSDGYPQLFGFEPPEFPTTSLEWRKRIHPDDLELVLKANQQHLETHEPFEIDFRWQAKDGRWIWIHSAGEVVKRDNQGHPLRMIGVHTDITERKHNEEVLRVLAESGTTDKGNIFEIIVRQLALSQNVRYALIAVINPDDITMANTLALSSDGEIIDNFSYLLKGTPCEKIINEGSCIYPDNVQRLFPDDHLLVDMSAQCYVGVPLKNNQNKVIGLLALIDDTPMTEHSHPITLLNSLATRAGIELERKISNEQLDLSARVFTDTHEGIVITDAAGTIVDVNPAFCKITGFSRDEALGCTSNILNSGKQSPEFYQDMWQTLIQYGHWQGEIWNRKKNGELLAEILTISSLKDAEDNTINYIGMFSDITDSKRQQQKLELMAHYDTLTQLPNRSLFADRFTQAVAHSKRSDNMLAIAFIDLDDFKPVNDNYGHKVGDLLLIEVAKRIKENIREEDTVSRQGGDEFALLLGNMTSFAQCEQMIERIHHALAQPYLIDGYPHKISASSGITLYPLDDADLDTLLRHADRAMYQAKLAGKNCYHLFNALDDRQTIQKHSRIQEIEQALSDNEFVLYYQPKVNMKMGVVFGAEALIRWIHPEKGLIPPLDFLPFIDGTNLEIKIGDWVIHEALKQLDKWRVQGLELEVSINISSYHLQSESFLEGLEQAMADHPKVNSQYLQLEILESSALSNINKISKIIKACRSQLGVNIALDDFGTGYSSLTHLKNLSAGTIKVDRTFVRDILDDPSDYAIIDGVIALANSFNRDVIAEGVETDEQGLMLLVMGCNEAQGFGIAKPMPADDVVIWKKTYIPNEKWISCGQKERSLHEKKIMLFKITSKHWIDHFTTTIQSPPEDIEYWPIMVNTKCHCGSWIRREKQEHLFKQNWLDDLSIVHEERHRVAHELLLNYQAGEFELARNGLGKLQIISNNINTLLEQYNK